MEKRSPALMLAAALLALGAVMQGTAVTLYWRPCAGAMLNGSVLNGYRFDRDFTAACSVAMDEASAFPLPQPGDGLSVIGALGAAAAVLLALAWLVVLLALPLSRVRRLVASLPALLGLVVVANAVTASLLQDPDAGFGPLATALVWTVAISTPIGLACLVGNRLPSRLTVSAVIVVLAATAPGLLAQLWDYGIMSSFSEANWDSPPGSGYVTTTMLALAALVIAVLALRAPGRASRQPTAAEASPALR